MQIVNFNISSILAERRIPKSNLELRNNIVIRKVAPAQIPGLTKPALTVHFVYNVDYSPGVGVINIFCNVTAIMEEEESKAILDQWEKEKKVDQQLINPMMHFLLTKCHVHAHYLSDLISLPPPFPIANINPTVESLEELKKRQQQQEPDKKEQKAESKPEKKKK